MLLNAVWSLTFPLKPTLFFCVCFPVPRSWWLASARLQEGLKWPRLDGNHIESATELEEGNARTLAQNTQELLLRKRPCSWFKFWVEQRQSLHMHINTHIHTLQGAPHTTEIQLHAMCHLAITVIGPCESTWLSKQDSYLLRNSAPDLCTDVAFLQSSHIMGCLTSLSVLLFVSTRPRPGWQRRGRPGRRPGRSAWGSWRGSRKRWKPFRCPWHEWRRAPPPCTITRISWLVGTAWAVWTNVSCHISLCSSGGGLIYSVGQRSQDVDRGQPGALLPFDLS